MTIKCHPHKAKEGKLELKKLVDKLAKGEK